MISIIVDDCLKKRQTITNLKRKSYRKLGKLFMKSISQIMQYVEDTEKCATFWVEKIGFTLKQTMLGPAETTAFVLVPQADSETAIVLLNKRAVAEYSPEVNLETPSLMFSCDDVKQTRENLTRLGVVVGDIVQIGNVLTCNFCDPEGHYFAFSESK